jgi:catechol-2,3-dioxygenase
MAAQQVVAPVLHHVNLKTSRLDGMIEWYGLVVGTVVTHKYEGGAWLSNDGANHRIALLANPAWEDDSDKLQHTGLHHTAYEYASMDALLDSYGRLREHGILPHASLDHGMTLSFYYVDPDGNSVELQCDVFGDWDASKRFMIDSPNFAENPIGVTVDPELIVQARARGATPEDIHRRAYAGEFTPQEPLDLRLPATVAHQQ